MERSCFGVRQLLCENGERAQLQYYCLREPVGALTAYGAEIILQRAGERESASVRRFTTSQARMGELLSLLYRSCVPPCALLEALTDEGNKS